MSKSYFLYHLHSDYSNTTIVDSTSKIEQYIERAKEEGMTALAFSEHGNLQNHIKKKQLIEKSEMKYVHGIEAYVTSTLSEKIADNFHIGLYAKNYDGFLELNKLVSNSSNKEDNHFYYRPRISFDELYSTSSNIIITTACLGNFMWQWEKENNWYQQKLFLDFAQRNRDRVFLEIQYHNNKDQIDYNKALYGWAQDYNLRLIAGTDTHNVDDYAAECRSILQKAKGIVYSNEDSFDLTFKTYNELVEAFEIQDSIPMKAVMTAIENTNVFADMVEEFELDYSFKYPTLYDNPDKLLKERVVEAFKLKRDAGILDINRLDEYKDRIKEEYNAYKKLGMASYMLFVGELCQWSWDNDIPINFGRGSVTGSIIAYLLNITDVDSVKWGTVFSRFINVDRVSLPDIDLDFAPDDREKVYSYIRERMGNDNTSKIITFMTSKDKGSIDAICRALNIDISTGKRIKDVFETSEQQARDKYPNVMYYFDGVKGTIVSNGVHPAGMIASPSTLSDNLGTIRDSNNEVISSCDMKGVDSLNYVKLDILGLKNIAIVDDVFKYVNKDYMKSHEFNFDDQDVWDDIKKSPVGIFQMSNDYAFDALKRFDARSLDDMSIVNAAIRPSGASYRDRLFAGVINNNPSKEIDEILKDTRHFIIFQEQTIRFLQIACGFSGSASDNIRRYISKKMTKELEEAIPKVIDGYCENAGKDKSREIAEQEAEQFIQTLQDSADYQFSYNHALPYSMLGFTCGYLRYKHPIEFTTAFLNNANNEEDYINGEKLAKLKGFTIRPIKFSRSKGSYVFNKQEMAIYKGFTSIKYLQEKIANELYELAEDNEYDNFVDLLVDIVEKTSVDTRQLKILVKSNFFSDIDEIGKLLDVTEEFLSGKNKYQKTYVEKTKIKRLEFLHNYEDNIGDSFVEFDIIDRVQFEQDILGKATSKDEDYPGNRYVVRDIDVKYSPKLKLYRVSNGKEYSVKIYKSKYKKGKKIKKGDILVIRGHAKKHPKFMGENGNWVEDKTRKEVIITSYDVISYED